MRSNFVAILKSTCKIKEFKKGNYLGSVLHFKIPQRRKTTSWSRKETEEYKRLPIYIASHSC